MNVNFISPLNSPLQNNNNETKEKINILQNQKIDLKLNIILTAPRGFCAGVRRAVEIVERAIEKYGVPLYVRHEIVHNKFVVEYFKNKGVIFIDDERNVPNGSLLIYSAHGVSDLVEQNSKNQNLKTIDATCPLVKKVHREVILYDNENIEIILIGHKNHPEMLGTSGRIKSGNFVIIETIEDATKFIPKDTNKLAIATQTTLSMMETKHITDYLVEKFPSIREEERLKNDICYATENRQKAVKDVLLKTKSDILIVIGATNSSNSNRLADIGGEFGIKSFLTEKFDIGIVDFIASKLKNKKEINLVLTAGASAPEILVDDFIKDISAYFTTCEHFVQELVKEDVYFILPKEVR